ncbi:MAG: carbohydrate ABC transporter permease [Actinomycetaceae bacterium]|nr:carbohydrate ABC transporter permease [Actinomycetaceae bacterium]
MTVQPATRPKKRRVIKTLEDYVLDTVIYIALVFLCITTIYPFLNTLALSFNNAIDSVRGGIYVWPREFTLRNYEKILIGNPLISRAMFISATRAVLGSLTAVFANLCVAYVLSRRDFVLRKVLTPFLVFTMYFSGGLIPSFMLMRSLHLMNNFLVYILPGMVGAYNVMVMRSFIEGLPDGLIEAAKIDGASEYRILFSIVWPLSIPVVATITLFVAVGQWNAWFDTMLYCSSKKSLTTLQFELQKLLTSAQNIAATDQDAALATSDPNRVPVTPTSIRTAMTIIAVTPILFTYPFLQKYFIQGLTLGGVKG